MVQYASYVLLLGIGRMRSGTAQLAERQTKKARHSTGAGWSPRCGKEFFSQSYLPVQTLLRCPYSPRVQSHAAASVHTLKIPNSGSHTIVWTNENAAPTERNG